MKSFWNFIRNNWLYAFINIFGLTASLTFVILLAVYVNRQLTTDAFQKIAQVYDSINPGGPFEASFIEDQIADTFAEYIQLKKIIIIFTVISVFVSSLGLFAMSTYYIRARSRKIAVQKVFGASKRLVMGQTVSSYVILSVIAFVISVPVSRILTATWMTQFTYRIDTGFQWMLIFTSGVLACIIALATVLYQCIKAVDASPVTPLRRDD